VVNQTADRLLARVAVVGGIYLFARKYGLRQYHFRTVAFTFGYTKHGNYGFLNTTLAPSKCLELAIRLEDLKQVSKASRFTPSWAGVNRDGLLTALKTSSKNDSRHFVPGYYHAVPPGQNTFSQPRGSEQFVSMEDDESESKRPDFGSYQPWEMLDSGRGTP
jgi:hypothetical protein